MWVPKYDSFGPHYASAYGIAMMIHHRVDQPPNGDPIFQGLTKRDLSTHPLVGDIFYLFNGMLFVLVLFE